MRSGSYEPCGGTGKRGVNPSVAHTAGLGSKFSHMNGKTYGQCPVCERTGLVLVAAAGSWSANDRGTQPKVYIPRHKTGES